DDAGRAVSTAISAAAGERDAGGCENDCQGWQTGAEDTGKGTRKHGKSPVRSRIRFLGWAERRCWTTRTERSVKTTQMLQGVGRKKCAAGLFRGKKALGRWADG